MNGMRSYGRRSYVGEYRGANNQMQEEVVGAVDNSMSGEIKAHRRFPISAIAEWLTNCQSPQSRLMRFSWLRVCINTSDLEVGGEDVLDRILDLNGETMLEGVKSKIAWLRSVALETVTADLVTVGENVGQLAQANTNDLVLGGGGVDELRGRDEDTDVSSIIADDDTAGGRGAHANTVLEVVLSKTTNILVAVKSIVDDLVAHILSAGLADEGESTLDALSILGLTELDERGADNEESNCKKDREAGHGIQA